MIKERSLANKLAQTIRETLRSSAVVIKHNDKSTAGIPDISVSYNGYTSWLELKRLDRDEHILRGKDPLSQVQLLTLMQLQKVTGNRAWCVAYRIYPRQKLKFTEFYNPRLVTPGGYEYSDTGSGENLHLGLYVSGLLRQSTVVPRVEHFNHLAVTQLIIATHTEDWHRGSIRG